jgi:hypothetical protein
MVEYRTGVLDTPWITYRAYKAYGPGGAIEQVIRKFIDFRARYDIPEIIFAWEARGKDHGMFRKRIFAGYKAGRPTPDSAYLDVCKELQEMLPLLGAYQAWSPAEADDIAHTITSTRPGPHLLYAADHDWLAYIKPGTDMLKADCSQRPKGLDRDDWRRPQDKLITVENIADVTGLTAAGWFEVLCMEGCSTDKIPGLPRVGPVTARKLHDACPTLVRDLVDGVECGNCGGRGSNGDEFNVLKAQQGDEGWSKRDCPNCGGTGQIPDEVTHRDLRALVAATAPEMAQWAEVAISNAAALRLSADLVRPYSVELTVEPPRVGGLDELRTWMAGHGLEAMFEQVARLVPDEDDWAAPAPVVDDAEVPF